MDQAERNRRASEGLRLAWKRKKAMAKQTGGRRVFAKITETGICDPKGRASYAIGWKGRTVASAEKPVTSLVVTLLVRIRDCCGWDSVEEAKADIATTIEYLREYEKDIEQK